MSQPSSPESVPEGQLLLPLSEWLHATAATTEFPVIRDIEPTQDAEPTREAEPLVDVWVVPDPAGPGSGGTDGSMPTWESSAESLRRYPSEPENGEPETAEPEAAEPEAVDTGSPDLAALSTRPVPATVTPALALADVEQDDVPVRGQSRRSLLPVLVAITVISFAAFLWFRPADVPVRMSLTQAQVMIGETYFATASGFRPGESVTFSWTGPTEGQMGTFTADSDGQYVQGPIIEQDPPGYYRIKATGLTSARTAETSLRVVVADQCARGPAALAAVPC